MNKPNSDTHQIFNELRKLIVQTEIVQQELDDLNYKSQSLTDEILTQIIDHFNDTVIYHKYDANNSDLSHYKRISDKSRIHPIEELHDKKILVWEDNNYSLTDFHDIPILADKKHIHAIHTSHDIVIVVYPDLFKNTDDLGFGYKSDVIKIKELNYLVIHDHDFIEILYELNLKSKLDGKIFSKKKYRYCFNLKDLTDYIQNKSNPLK